MLAGLVICGGSEGGTPDDLAHTNSFLSYRDKPMNYIFRNASCATHMLCDIES